MTVTFSDATDSDRDFSSSIEDAIEYWNGRTAQYSRYNVTFSYQPELDSGEADIVVVASRPITSCDGTPETHSFAGCYRHEHRFDVYVNQTDLQFRNTAIHEFGHALGLDHDDAPHWVMANRDTELDGSVTDARDRENSWNTTGPLRVAVGDSLNGQANYENALEDAADYYNTNDQYVPDGMEIVVVDDPYEAHVVVEDSSETTYQFDGPGSVGSVLGLDYDADDEFEQYVRGWIYLNEVDPEDAEFHVGHWIGYQLGNPQDDLPSRYSN